MSSTDEQSGNAANVRRLRSLADELRGPGHWTREEAESAERILRSAADEIERLRPLAELGAQAIEAGHVSVAKP